MSKVGLKDTLALLAKGYSKKEIDALAAIDEEADSSKAKAPAPDPIPDAPAPDPIPDAPAPDPVPDAPAPAAASKDEPDYKKMYEDLLAKHEKTENTLKQIQKDNVHKDSAPAAAEAKKQEAESLTALVRGFM